MIIAISPAKRMAFAPPGLRRHTSPEFSGDAQKLVSRLKKMSTAELRKLMNVSSDIADLNFERYRKWRRQATTDNAKQALLAFRGDVYLGLDADTLERGDFDFAQQHLRVLSGLYGLLKPLDLMQPYRLEMGTRLATDRGRDLYAFWGGKITRALNRDLGKLNNSVLVNLASREYFRAIKPDALEARIITPVFKERKNGEYKVISFVAKRARGVMARYLIRNRIVDAARIKRFREDGYDYNAALSNDAEWVFTRG